MAVVPMLSLLIALPLAGAVLLLLIRNHEGERDRFVHWVALGMSLVCFSLTLIVSSLGGLAFLLDRHAAKRAAD